MMSRASARQTLRCRDNIRYLFHNSIQRTEAQMDCWLYNSVTPFVIFCLFFLLFETTINPSPSPFFFSVTPNFSSPFAQKNSPRTNRLNSFVSPFSLFKEFKMTQSENSFDSSLSLKQKISKD